MHGSGNSGTAAPPAGGDLLARLQYLDVIAFASVTFTAAPVHRRRAQCASTASNGLCRRYSHGNLLQLLLLHSFHYRYVRVVASYPWPFVLAPVVITMVLLLGFVKNPPLVKDKLRLLLRRL